MRLERVPSGMLMANSYLVMDEENKKAFLVDAGGYSDKIANLLEETGCKLEYIILTHGHGDHTDGVPKYREKYPDVKVIASISEKNFMLQKGMSFARTEITADEYVIDYQTMKIGSFDLLFMITPGHTPGGMCIYMADQKILFSGDTLFHGSVGRSDFPGGSHAQLTKSIKTKLFELDDDVTVYPGHDTATTIGDEKLYNPYVHL